MMVASPSTAADPLAALLFGHAGACTRGHEEELPSFMTNKARIVERRMVEPPGHAKNEDADLKKAASNEEQTEYFIQMEVPGVQAPQVTIEESDGEIEIVALRLDDQGNVLKTYQDVFYISPRKAEISKLVATLKDGILSVRVPKKAPEVFSIDVEHSVPPTQFLASNAAGSDRNSMKVENDSNTKTDEDSDLRLNMDLPGVHINKLKVKVQDNRILLRAERSTLAGHNIPIHHQWEVASSFNLKRAHSYLQNGVFTLIVPKRSDAEEGETERHLVAVRTFYATPAEDATDAVLDSVAAMDLSEAKKAVDGAVEVETVEHDEEDAWEDVGNADGSSNASENDCKPAAEK